MIRIIDSRASGKTSRLMAIAKESGAKFVCSNSYAMKEKSYKYGLTGIDFITYQDMLTSTEEMNVVIDELEVFTKRHLPSNVNMIGYTLSAED